MTRSIRRSVVFAGIAFTSMALAGGTATGQIDHFMTGNNNGQEFLLVYFASVTGAPTCSVAPRFIMLSTDVNYKSTLAIVMASYYSGSIVTVVGTGACSTWTNTEEVSYICAPGGC